jgi:hypothetical protein
LRIESEDWLLALIFELGDEYRRLLSHVKFEFLRPEAMSTVLSQFSYEDMTDAIWSSLARRLRGEEPSAPCSSRYGRRGFTSAIVPGFPHVLSVIEKNNVRLLYRDTRDGFTAANFDPLVSGHSKLLILVQDTGGWIFGSYTHCKWPNNEWATDSSAKSFLFTLKNPHNIPPRRFAMKAGQEKFASYFRENRNDIVWIGYSGAIALTSGCNQNSNSHSRGFADTNANSTFANDSGHDGMTLFTGSETYTVKELEVFEFLE